MPYMLDTNICIYVMKHHPPEVRERLRKIAIGDVFISGIVLAELWYGIGKSQHREKNKAALENFLQYCAVQDWPHEAAPVYGELRAALEKKGAVIGGNDLFIAAHAKHLGATLVTNNVKEFKRISGLKVENWI